MKDYEDYVDPRAYKFFRFSGSSHSETLYSWDTQSGAKPTKVLKSDTHMPVCAYCGRRGLPLQPNIAMYRDYDVTGHTCACKEAMDEIDMLAEIERVRSVADEAIAALKRNMPKINSEVVQKLMKADMDRKIERLQEDQERGWGVSEHNFDNTSIRLIKGGE